MSGALEECVFNVPHVICGVALQPPSIWHVWLLEFVRSPYVGAAEDGTAADLALALHLCAFRAESPRTVGEISFQFDPLLIAKIEEFGIRQTSLAFQNYLRDHLAFPKCWEKEGSRPVKSPVCLYLVAVLMRCGRMDHDAAWAMPFGYARHLCLALAEAGGNEIPLVTGSEEKALREAGYQL